MTSPYVTFGYWAPGYCEGDEAIDPASLVANRAFEVSDTVISQFANSPTLYQLCLNMGQYLDPRADLDAFYSAVWNIDTAYGAGLDVWGKIVNVSRQLTITVPPDNLGFDEGDDYQPFGQAPFYAGAPATSSYTLADPAYRTLILVKALANISSCTARSLNQLLQNLFKGRGRCYVSDTGGMAMRFTFEFALLPYEIAILTQSGAVPRPAAVDARILQVDIPSTFGFGEAGTYQTFGYGVLFNPSIGLLNAA